MTFFVTFEAGTGPSTKQWSKDQGCPPPMTDATMAPTSLERDWMTPEEFRTWYERLKAIDPRLTHAELGRRLDHNQSTITRWMNDNPGRGKSEDEGKGRRIEHGAALQLALERLEQILIEEQKPKRRRRQEQPG